MRILEEKTCRCACGTKLAYTEEDLHGGEDCKYIVCPQCGKQIAIIDRDVYVCDHCRKDFEVTDAYIGDSGSLFAKCPHCGSEEWIGNGVDLDETNICFPQHFYHYANEGTVAISDEQTTKYVRECAARLDKDFDYAFTGSGDTLCFAVKTDESTKEATVFVCKNHYECSFTLPEDKF